MRWVDTHDLTEYGAFFGAGDFTYIGPILWQKQEAKLPDWIDHLSREKPLIWVYSGNPRYSSASDSLDSIVVLHACVAALAGEDVQVVLTTGHHPLPREVLSLPANFRHEPYVPGLAMAERSDLLIHHSGYGSCQTGLYAGKPAVIIPTYSERESNARRIAALGAGAFVPVETASGEKRVRAEELRATIRRVLADPSFADNARRTGERMRAYGGAPRAAHLIERFKYIQPNIETPRLLADAGRPVRLASTRPTSRRSAWASRSL